MSSINNRWFVYTVTAATSRRTNCRHRQDDRVAKPVRTVVDDSGSLAITAWTCAACGDLIEEVRILPNDRHALSALATAAVASTHKVTGASAQVVVK